MSPQSALIILGIAVAVGALTSRHSPAQAADQVRQVGTGSRHLVGHATRTAGISLAAVAMTSLWAAGRLLLRSAAYVLPAAAAAVIWNLLG